jgi:hypothetical protein
MIDNVELQSAERILAFEVRSRRIGFAALEGPTRLLDWGVRSCSCPTPGLRECVAKIVKPLLFHYDPVAVVMRRENQYSSKTASRLRVSMGAIRREANRCGIEFRFLKTKARKRFFVQFRCETKYQIAQLIAELFEELAWRVQPRRRAWHSESYHAVIFDATATGLADFADEFNSDTVQEVDSSERVFSSAPPKMA